MTTKTIALDNTRFESQFARLGLHAQRAYPNEQLVVFCARHLFAIPPPERATTRVLELGCGGGGNLWMIAREGFAAYGIDLSPSGLEMCRRRLEQWGAQADLRLANMRSIPFDDAFFNAIVDVHSMQHLDRQGHEQALGEVARCLKPGGHFFSFHLGSRSYSHTHGGGVALDDIAIDNVSNAEAPYAGDGLVSFLDRERATALMQQVGLKVLGLDRIMRFQGEREIPTEYLALTCAKSEDRQP